MLVLVDVIRLAFWMEEFMKIFGLPRGLDLMKHSQPAETNETQNCDGINRKFSLKF
jgi:hypothetical protein